MDLGLGRILDSIPGMVLAATPDGEVDFVNRRWSKFAGLGSPLPNGLDWEQQVHPRDLSDFLQRWQSVVSSGEPGEMKTRLRRFDGRYRSFIISCNPMRDDDGRIVKWYGLATDVGDERSVFATETTVAEFAEKQGLEESSTGMRVLTPSAELAAANDHIIRYFGKTEEELRSWGTAGVHPEDLQGVVAAIDQAVATGNTYDSEHRLLSADGNYRWFQVCGHPLRDAAGRVSRWYALHIDINERKMAEEALRASEVDLRRIINALPTTAWSTRPDGFVDFLSDRWLDYSGMSPEQAIGFGWADVIHPDDADGLFNYWQTCLASGNSADFEGRMRRYDGEYRWFLFRANPLRDESGTIIKWYGTNIDIEDRKRAEEELRASESSLNQIINTIPTAAWSTRPDGYCDFLHHRWLAYAGLTADQAMGWGWRDAMHPDDVDRLVADWQASLASGTAVDTEARIRRFDGEYRWFLFRGNPLRDEAGNIARWYGTNVDIEDRKRAEEALAESERQSRLIVNTIPGLVSIFGPNGETEGVNEQFLEYLGQTFDEFQSWRANGTVHPEDFEGHVEAFARSFVTGDPIEFESRLRRFDGAYRWFHLRGNPLRDPEGRIIRWYCLMTDADDRRCAEEAVRESEINLRNIINTLPTASWSTLPDGYVDFLNDRWLDYAAMTMEQAGGFGWAEVVHPEDANRLLGYWQSRLESGEPVDIEARMRRYDGIYRWFLFRANPLRDEDGTIIKWYGTNIDIEDRRRADEAQQRERQSRLIVDTIPGMIALFSPDGELEGANSQLLQYFSQPLEKVRRWATNGMTHPEDLQSCIDAFTASIKTGEPYEVETRFLRHDGVYRWFQIRGLPLREGDGNIVRWYGLLTDIDGRKGAEEELRRSEAFLADAQRVSRTGSFAGVIGSENVTWSDETYRIYGVDLGKPVTLDLIRSRLHPDNVAAFEQVMYGAQCEGSVFDYETRLVIPDQSIKYVRVVAHSERNRDGALELRGAVRDVTSSHLAEEALNKARSDLAHVARVTSLGVLTASIAHEVNQPLSGIIINSGTCLRMLAEEPPNIEVAKETARRMIRDGNRASEVITRLRALFSKNPFAIEPVDLNEAVREVLVLSQGDLERSRVILRAELANDLPLVEGDRVQLQQVILNLLRNGTEAMIDITDRLRQLQVSTIQEAGNRVRVSVRDVGVGFSDDDAERVFEAFYSTKSEGMGIGLSVSQSIIESHKGRLWATPNEGPGVTVSFSIPQYAGNEVPANSVDHANENRNTESSARIS